MAALSLASTLSCQLGLPADHDDAAITASNETPANASPCADPQCAMLFAALCVSYGYTPHAVRR